MVTKIFNKDPSEVLDYGFDWSDWLETGDTISTSSYTVGTGLTADSDEKTTTTTTVWLSGGTAGESYTVTNNIVTAEGRTGERSFSVNVLDR